MPERKLEPSHNRLYRYGTEKLLNRGKQCEKMKDVEKDDFIANLDKVDKNRRGKNI